MSRARALTLRSPFNHAAAVKQAAAAPSFAVISDIHSNLPALRAVLAEIDRRGVTAVVCLGDIVGYGSRPAECLRALRERRIPCLRGNHDEMAATGQIPRGVSAGAVAGIHYTRSRLAPRDSTFLATLPWTFTAGDLSFVHASFPEPEDFRYVHGEAAARAHLLGQPTLASFFGHTHIQGGIRLDDVRWTRPQNAQPARLRIDDWTACNPGSVGQPRDGDPRAAFLICHPALPEVEFARVGYDVGEAVADMISAGLPSYLSTRLRSGL